MSGRLAPAVAVCALLVCAPLSPVLAAGASSFGTVSVSSPPTPHTVPSPGIGGRETQTQVSDSSDSIEVQGNERIEAETVKSYMTVKDGREYSETDIDASIKALFATGLFADVAIAKQGGTVMVKVVENPIINRIAFEGNKRVDDKTLEPEIQLKPRLVFTQNKVQEDVKRILDVYRRSGRYAVTVEPKVIKHEQNRVDLVFEINEGPPTYIRRINFVGNKRYSDSTLREEIASREERWYRFFSSVDTYDPDRTTYDRELLRRYYLRNGYSDFRVVSSVAELLPDQSGFFVTFTLDEGERYKFGKLDLDVRIPDVDPEVLRANIKGATDDWYNADEVENSVQAITDAVGAMGYAFVDVRPRIQRNKDTRTIDIVYDVQEGPRVFVERIDIGGNSRTLDRVIRREILLSEGDAFNTAKLRRSREKIRDLGFFEKVDVNNVPSDTAPDRTIVQVDVAEQSTGELSFGVGWSSIAGALFDVSVRERNLLGRGQDLSASFTIGERKQEIDLSFTEPYFLDRPLAAGVDLFKRKTDYQDSSSYDLGETGAGLRLGFNYTDHWRQSVRYTISETELTDIDSTASKYIQQRAGKSLLSAFGQSIAYDRRDSAVNPSEGYILRLSNELAGAGGDEKYLSTMIEARNYYPVAEDTVWVIGGTAGYIQGLGEDVRYIRNYNLGGDNLRGFEYGGASPRDKSTSDVLGGNWIVNGTTELQFPLGLPEELGVKGKAFSDFGMVGKPDGVAAGDLNSSSKLRMSVGVGFVWKSPFGPLNIDVAQPILKEKFDKKEIFRFGFGTRF